MLILISSPTKVNEEATLINHFFDEGLDLLHLRKPQDSKEDVMALIEKIDSRYHIKISLHQHHQLIYNYGINRLHFSEHVRRGLRKDPTQILINRGYQLSTSVHSTEEFELLHDAFSYSFIGPVFDSISKPGYTAKVENVRPSVQRNIKAVAIGGIKASNVHQLKGHFEGAAILGAIWCSDSPLSHFLQIRKIWNTIDP